MYGFVLVPDCKIYFIVLNTERARRARKKIM